MKSFQTWIGGIISAMAGGAMSSLIAVGFAPETFNFNDGAAMGKTAAIAGAGALMNVLNYLKDSPLPKKEEMKVG